EWLGVSHVSPPIRLRLSELRPAREACFGQPVYPAPSRIAATFHIEYPPQPRRLLDPVPASLPRQNQSACPRIQFRFSAIGRFRQSLLVLPQHIEKRAAQLAPIVHLQFRPLKED